MTIINRRFAALVVSGGMLVTLAWAQAPMPKTITESVKGASTVKTEELHGTVAYAEGNELVVRMSTGEMRQFHVPESRRFNIDGKELTTNELKPGTKLSATITTTTTPVTDRTTTIGSGKVFWVNGNNVIVTLPNNENRMYKVSESYRFVVEGKRATVHELRKGMVISAEKIVEQPRTEIATNTVVTGTAPAPRVVAQAPAPTPTPEPRLTPAPEPAQVAQARPRETARQQASPQEPLPATGSNLHLIGIVGLCLIVGSVCLRKLWA